MIARGYKEIQLLGQNVNSYGLDKIGTEMSFAQLLKSVAQLEGDFWLRFHAPHPRDFNDDVIAAIARNPKICRQINLPAQSGSAKILRRMNRPYTPEQYLDIINRIKAGLPNVSLSTDIIVGFCGETPADFEQSKALLETVGYDMAFVAPYSQRPGTVAARRFEDDVPVAEKKRRHDILTEVLQTSFMNNQLPRLGSIQKVLVEKYSKDHWLGRNEHFITVEFQAPPDAPLAGTFQNVHLEKVTPFRFIGELIA